MIIALGLAPVFTLATDLIVGTAPPERAGAASAISETSAELGGALGIAILGSIGIAVYRDRLADAMPAGVPTEESDAAIETLGGALEAVERLPDALGTELLDAAQEAFTQGLQIAAVAGAGLAVATAVLCAVMLRRVTPGAPEDNAVPGGEAVEAARS